ncbi:MAG: hypothetical protein M3O36_11340 [Myxococcota bacterium]|nr:hypothetical protein [Myxococcota bacterium]
MNRQERRALKALNRRSKDDLEPKFEALEEEHRNADVRWRKARTRPCDCCGRPFTTEWEYAVADDGTILERRSLRSTSGHVCEIQFWGDSKRHSHSEECQCPDGFIVSWTIEGAEGQYLPSYDEFVLAFDGTLEVAS